jgi:hypothetical protein
MSPDSVAPPALHCLRRLPCIAVHFGSHQMASAYQLRILRIRSVLAGLETAFEAQEIQAPARRCARDILATDLDVLTRVD